MKKQLLKITGLVILFVLPLSLVAQNRGGQGRVSQEERAKQEMTTLKKTLELKKDQTVKFEKIYTDFNKKRGEVMTKMREGGDREGMREKMTKMTDERNAALKKVLDKGQVKKFDAYLKKQAEERQNRGTRGGNRDGGGRL